MANARAIAKRTYIAITTILITVAFATVCWPSAASALEKGDYQVAYDGAKAAVIKYAEEKDAAQFARDNDWTAFCLARARVAKPNGFLSQYVQNATSAIEKKDGNLSSTQATEYARVILALTAANQNASKIGHHNLLTPLSDMNFVTQQGINGPVFTLLAIDSKDYSIPTLSSDADSDAVQTTRDGLVAAILAEQHSDGGWAFTKSAPSDVDMTAMALQALAPYMEKPSVKKAIDSALSWLSSKQNAKGDFGTCESDAQVIVALTSLDMSPVLDSAFVKKEGNALDGLCLYYKDGRFCHILGKSANEEATKQAFYALVSYSRFLNGASPLYQMNDAATTSSIERKVTSLGSAPAKTTTTAQSTTTQSTTTQSTTNTSKKSDKTTSTKKNTKSTKTTKTTKKSNTTTPPNPTNRQPITTNPRVIPGQWTNAEADDDDDDEDLDEDDDDEDLDDEDVDDLDDLDEDEDLDDEDADFDDDEDIYGEGRAAGYADRPYWGQLPTPNATEQTEIVLTDEERAEQQRQLLITIGAVLATLAGAALVALLGRVWQLRCEGRHAK